MNWINVKDELPEVNQDVLCYLGKFGGNIMEVNRYVGDDKWRDDFGFEGDTEGAGITHWIALPKPPKGEME